MADENKRPEGEEAESERQPEHQPEKLSDTTGLKMEEASQDSESIAGSGATGSAADVKAASPMEPLPGSQDADSAAAAIAPATKLGEEHAGTSQHGPHESVHGEHGLSHTTSVPLLLGVFAALTILTILTVGVTAIDLGSQGNFIVAMVIATIKAALVMGLFMHMLWDSKFNVMVFVSSFLFVLLFLSMSLADRSEYQRSIDTWETAQTSQ
jgi:cytochrome c oxidase subunit 4